MLVYFQTNKNTRFFDIKKIQMRSKVGTSNDTHFHFFGARFAKNYKHKGALRNASGVSTMQSPTLIDIN